MKSPILKIVFGIVALWALIATGLLIYRGEGEQAAQSENDYQAGEGDLAAGREDATAGDTVYASRYTPLPRADLFIKDAVILDGAGAMLTAGDMLVRDGVIRGIGTELVVPEGTEILAGEGFWLTPGLIDIHSHLGVSGSPRINAHGDNNESSAPNRADVWAEHSVWPQDPGFSRALAGGVTTLQILPGSANLFGGRSAILKTVPATTVHEMKFPDAPHGLKMACGENPKSGRGQYPKTRMGIVAGMRAAWQGAQKYRQGWEAYEAKLAAGESAMPPNRDFKLETMAKALAGEIELHFHCYRADDMAMMMTIADEFDLTISTFHHASEAYKIADTLAQNEICAAVWDDWWGFKMEAYDGIRENAALVHAAGGCAIIHSDSPVAVQRLNQHAAKALGAAKRAGFDISPAEAVAWITSNPAKAMGLEDKIGSLEVGKNADFVVWDGDPFSVYSRVQMVYIDGALAYDLDDPAYQPVSDFELGQLLAEGGQ